MSERRDMTKAAASLIADMVARAATKQVGHAVSPQEITRRPPPTMPNVSPRGAELINAILATRTPTLTPNTAGGGVQTGQPGAGFMGGMVPDRASLLAQNPQAYDVGQSPLLAQQAGAEGGQPTGEPTDPVQRYALGLSPIDDKGQTFPNWESLDSEYQDQIWQQYAQAQGIDLTGAQQGPATAAAPTMVGMDRPGMPGTNTIAQNPNAIKPPTPVVPQENPQLTGVVKSRWTNPPPGWSEGPEDDADWQEMSQSNREKVWRMYAESAQREAPSQIQPIPPSEQTSVRNPVGGGIRKGVGFITEAAGDIRESPPGQAVEKYVVDPVIAAAGWAEHKNQQGAADSAYYMMTHNGELPPTGLDPRTWFQGWLLSGNGSAFNPGSEEYMAAVQIVDETRGEEPSDPTTWSPETVAAYIVENHTDPFATDGNDNPLAQATMLTYLNDNPDKWDAAIAAYEEGGADGMLAWYNEDVGGWWNFASSIIMDPLNYALLLSIPGKALVGAADARTIGRAGAEVDRINKARRAAGQALNYAADPFSGTVEALYKGLGAGARRIGGGLTKSGEAGARRTAEEAIEEQAHVVDTMRGTSAEDEANQLRREQAEANVETQRVADEAAAAKADKARNKAIDDAKKIERQRVNTVENAKIARDGQVERSVTPKQRQAAISRFQEKVRKAQAKYDADIAQWESKNGMEPGSYTPETVADDLPAAPEAPTQTTIYEEPRPGSIVDSAAQRRAEDDDFLRRAGERRDAEVLTAEDVVPSGTVRMDPLEQRMVRESDRISDPEGVAAFQDDVRRQIDEDYAPTDRAMDNPERRSDRAIHDVEFQSNLETQYRDRFGGSSAYDPEGLFRKYSPTSEAGSIARFVFGNADEARVSWGNLERFATGNSNVSGGVARRMDDLVEYRNRVHGDADIITSGPSTITPSADVVARARGEVPPAPGILDRARRVSREPLQPASLADLPATFQRRLNEARADILGANADRSREVSNLLHKDARQLEDPALRKAWNNEINRLRDQSGHETSRTRRAAKRRGDQPGIVFDPWDKPTQLAEAVHSVIGKVVDRLPERMTGGPAKAAPNGVVIRGNVKYADELKRAWDQNISLTQRQVDSITTDVSLTIGTGKNAKTISTNFWDRFNDHLAEASSRRRGGYRKNGHPTTEEGWADELKMMTDEREAALAKTNDDFRQLYTSAKSSQLRKITHQAMGANRKYLQFNVITGPRAIFNDIVTNEKFMFLTGQGGAIRKHQRLLSALVKDELDELDILEHEVMKRVKDSGVTQLPPEIKHTIGREEVERSTLKRGKIDPRNLIESYWIKRIRGAGDNSSRYAIYANYFDGHLLEEQAKWLDFVRGKVRKNGQNDLFAEVQRAVQAGDFSADDIRAITRKFTNDDSYARTWAKQVDDLSQAATRKQRQIMFSYKKTKMDDALGKVFLFHYYMTRSTALYTKLMLQHPQLISMEAALWEASAENMKKFPGAPEWMQGFMGFARDNGHNYYTNPTMLLSGIGVLQSMGDGGFSRSKVEQALSTTGFFPQPMVRAALAVFGSALPGDPTGTSQLRRAVISTIDRVRFSDFGKEHGWDSALPWGDRPTPDVVQDIVNGIVDMANDLARELGAPLKDFEAASSGDIKNDQVKAILISNFQEEGGSTNPDEWPEDVYERYVAAVVAIEGGGENADVDVAVDEYVDMQFEQSALTVVSPTGSYVRDNETDVRQARERAARAVPYQDRTPEEEADVAVDDLEAAQSPQAVSLTEGMRKYNTAGTENQRIINQGVSQILYGWETMPDEWTATIGGETYTGAQLKRMTDDERGELADTYEREEGARAGVIVGAQTGDEQPTPLTSFRAERDRIKAANADVADYTEYRSYMLNAPNKRQTREGMLATNGGDTEFARQHNQYRDYLIGQGMSGEELEAALDEWIDSDGAYLAAMGFASRGKGETGRAIYDAANPPPWREEAKGEESATTGGGQFEPDVSGIDVTEARERIRAGSLEPDEISALVKNGTISDRDMRAWLRDGTLLHDDLYEMADVPGVTKTDIKYLFEDGFLSERELVRLVVDQAEEDIADVQRKNRQRKKQRERESETKSQERSSTSGNGSPGSYLFPKEDKTSVNRFIADYVG